jgi:predicted transcriptional regulator
MARKLKRDRSAVTRDVQVLERYGVVEVTERPLPGHGRQKWVVSRGRESELTARV